MKKIRSMRQLKNEKALLSQKKRELEDKLGSDWDQIQLSLSPRQLVKDSFKAGWSGLKETAADGKTFRSALLSAGAGFLVKKLAGKLWRKKRS
jgi:hypothetical protein